MTGNISTVGGTGGTGGTGDGSTGIGTNGSAGSAGGAGGQVNLSVSSGNIMTGNISTLGGTGGRGGAGGSGTAGGRGGSGGSGGSGGQVNLSIGSGNIVTRNISTNGGTGRSGSSGGINTSGDNGVAGIGGSVTLESDTITTGNIDSSGFDGGDIFVRARNRITTQEIISQGLVRRGGNVTLDPPNDVQVSFINAQGGSVGRGGNVFITTDRFFRATDTFTDRNGIEASISTAGGLPGSSIIIRHGGNGITPFNVQNLLENGTAGAITTGLDNIIAPASYFFTYRQTAPSGNIQIITGEPPSPPQATSVIGEPPKPPQATVIPPLALSTTLPCSSAVMAAVEGKLAQQYEKSLGSRLARKTVLDACEVLRGIQARIGINPALIYAVFVPPEVKPPNFQVSFDESEEDYLALILVTPTGGTYFPVRVKDKNNKEGRYVRRKEVRENAERFRHLAIRHEEGIAYQTPGAKLYEWLIETVKPELTAKKIDNLTFILDSYLREIPFAALYDKKNDKHLVEQYSLGMMPSLNLTDTRYAPIQNAAVLAVGRSDFRNALIPLDKLLTVPTEIDLIAKRLWNRSGNKAILDPASKVTAESLAAESQEGFGIIHISSHAQFKSETDATARTPEQISPGQTTEPTPRTLPNSFIQLSGTDVLTLDRFRILGLENPPRELLVLSACQTALGDPQAELGFAGLATQAGVKTALGSLWRVDEGGSLALMTEFYQQLGPARIKAEALRQAQLLMINAGKQGANPVRIERTTTGLDLVWSGGRVTLPKGALSDDDEIPDYRHPYYWSGFTLVGSPW